MSRLEFIQTIHGGKRIVQRLEYLQENRYYHIYNRGNNRENLFLEERNYDFFLARYQKYICPIADTFAYCLLRNHFHLLIRIKPQERPHRSPLASGSPSRAFSNFFSCYTQSMNSVYGRTGSLFQERFRRKEVSGHDSLRVVMQYIHLNPFFHMFTRDFRVYKHSSYHSLLGRDTTFLEREEVLHWFGNKRSFEQFHRDGELTGLI